MRNLIGAVSVSLCGLLLAAAANLAGVMGSTAAAADSAAADSAGGDSAATDAAARTTQRVIEHHFAMLEAGNLPALMTDFAEHAVLITPAGVIRGKAAIREAFGHLMHPPGANGAGMPPFSIKQQLFASDIAYLAWVQNEGTPRATRGFETYVVRHGKIEVETVASVGEHAAGGQ